MQSKIDGKTKTLTVCVIKTLNHSKVPDIIFHLLDWSGEARKNLVDYIIQLKQQTLKDGKSHNFSMPPVDNDSSGVGVTYISLNFDNLEELRKRLLTLCEARKYKSKGEAWIGFGSLKNSHEMIDLMLYNDHKWEYNDELEILSKAILEGNQRGKQIWIGKKIGKNEKCPCGSGLKFKKCCGDKIRNFG